MNKTVMMAVIGLIIAVTAVGGIFVMSKQNATPSTSTSEISQIEDGSALASIKDLFASGRSQECSFSDPAGNKGSVIVSGGKMRSDFVTASAQGTTSGHMIIDNGTSYIWMDGQTTGFKMEFDVNAVEQVNAPNEGLNLDSKVDYNCKTWAGGAASFELPKGVAFSDLSGFAVPVPNEAGASGNPSTSKAQQCAACDDAPEAYQAQCKSALGC